MDSATENGADHNPYKCGRPEHYAHDSAENRAKTCDIEKLDQKDLPCRQRDKIDAVTPRLRGHGTARVHAENTRAQRAIDYIAYDQNSQRYEKREHISIYVIIIL